MQLNDLTVKGLQALVGCLNTRYGRLVFRVAAALVFAGVGFNTVWRAEFPRKTFAPELRYDSPMVIGAPEDAQAEYRSSEFRGFRRIAWGVMMEGMDPYKDLVHVRAYPPFFAAVFFPFAALWKIRGLGSLLFYSIGFAFMLLSFRACGSWGKETGAEGRFGAFAFLSLLMGPLAMSVLARCESDMLALFPVALAATWLVKGRRPVGAGLLLGFAASLKVLPGVFGVYFLCRRQWRPLIGMAAGGVICTALLPAMIWGPQRTWELHASWYENVVEPYGEEGPGAFVGRPWRSTNQSLAAAAWRFLTPVNARERFAEGKVNVLSFDADTARVVVAVLHGATGLGLAAFWIWAGRREESAIASAALSGTVACGILLLSQVSLTSHHVLLLLPLAVVAARGTRASGAERDWAWVVPAVALLMATLACDPIKALSPMLAATLIALAACISIVTTERKKSRERASANGQPSSASA